MIPFFKERYGCAVGLSDHTGTIFPGRAAATMGIQVLEVHVTLTREMFGPDVPVSITTSELRQLVEGVRFIEKMIENPVDKNSLSDELSPLRDLFTKSIIARGDLPRGTVLREDHLTVKKPGTGIPSCRMAELIGRTLTRPVRVDQFIAEEDLE